MRHLKHRFQLGVKKSHRLALMANLSAALLKHGRIQTTKAKAKALRPFIEKIITLAKKAAVAQDPAVKLHYRRLAISRVRDKAAVRELFDNRVEEFGKRPGGYTRIYKLVPRRGDAAEMALIELIDGSDEGYNTGRKKKKSAQKKKTAQKKAVKAQAPVASESSESKDTVDSRKQEDNSQES